MFRVINTEFFPHPELNFSSIQGEGMRFDLVPNVPVGNAYLETPFHPNS